MKRKTLYLSFVALLIGAVAGILPVFAAGTNLLGNESVETAETAAKPLKWTANKWGTNTANLQYATNGKTGSRSLTVEMTAQTSGDAKWMHDAVAIKPNTSYTYTSAYKSSVATEIDLQYTDTSGNVSYAYVTTVTPSTNWATVSAKFDTPANAAKVVVMHIIHTKGTLQTDDFSLAETNATSNPTPPVTPPVPDEHAEHNLITNGSFETANGDTPAGWYKNSWGGTTATFTYGATGRTGARSASVNVTAHTGGDAKWFAETVPVTATKSYIYRDYYKSNVPTRVVVAFVDAANNYTYQEIAGAPASITNWNLYSATFTAPATAVKASVYHVVDRIGTLTIDDATLEVALPTPAIHTVSIPNASLEATSPAATAPLNWRASKWGNNTAVHEYMNEGRIGSKSAKVTVSNYVDGDAKWYFDPISSIKQGQQYRATIWYKTNVSSPRAVAMFMMADGSEKYFAMPVARPSGSITMWQQYTDTFSVPAGAVSASVFMVINQNGWLQTDDYSLTEYSPNGYSRPLLTMTFDDGHEENQSTALPILNQYGLKTTHCFATSFIEGHSQSVINGVLAFQKSGHEICSHTVSHPFLTSKVGADLTYELQHSKQYLESITGKPVVNFASPYGDYNTNVVSEIKKYYRSHRSVDEGYNSKDNFNAYNLRVQNVLDTTSASQIAAWIAQAKLNNTWLILVYHRVANDPGPYDSYINVFAEHAKTIKDSGIAIETFNDALNEVTAQQP
ncbi:MAG: polysaccharide deacetylase family protein [Candidatus Saccharimonadales bacterium]